MASETTALPEDRRVKVWDPWIRTVHWLIALLIPFSWWTAETHRFDLHVWSGYTVLVLLVFRIAWGFVGSHTARFATFLASPLQGLRHLLHFRRREPVEIGHNAAGGWMVLALLGLPLLQAVSGLFADDEIFTRGPLAGAVDQGTSALATSIHLGVFWVIVGAAVLHVFVILLYRLVRRQNLVGPMITGTLRLPASYRGPAPRMGSNWLAVAMLAVVAAAVWALVRWGEAQASASAFG